MEFNTTKIANVLTYFENEAHLLHWQTTSYERHMALGELYTALGEIKDPLIEKLMGYTGKRPDKFNIELGKFLVGEEEKLADAILEFAQDVEDWAVKEKYGDIEGVAQALGGCIAKFKYLLTLR